ncbi:MAG: D-alanyl-D-alanine carboxypeptidase family protein [Alphaproteobacteria bacterium]
MAIVITMNVAGFAYATTTAPQAIVYDMESKQILLNKNSSNRMYPASMTKIMTAYVVFDALKKGNLTMDTKFRISKKSWKKGGSKMFVKYNSLVSVNDLLHGVIVQSGNDAAIAIAEGMAGTEENFARIMNSYAKKLGMTGTHFTNSTGWPDKNHYTTAKDLVKLSIAMIRNFPEYYGIWGKREFTYNKIKQPNRNPLLGKSLGADGLKTGHTEISGYGLVASVKQGNRRLIFVLNGMKSKKERRVQSFEVAQNYLYNYKNVKILKVGQVLGDVKVVHGSKKSIPIISKKDLLMTVNVSQGAPVKAELQYKTPLVAPIKKGQEIGFVKITQLGKTDKVIPVYAGGEVRKQGFVQRAVGNIKRIILGQ